MLTKQVQGLSMLLLVACDSQEEARTPAAVAPVPPAAASTDWSAEVTTPLWAWQEDDGQVFVRFEWSLEYQGSEPDALVAAAEQRWHVRSADGLFSPSIHPDTLNGTAVSGQTRSGMFYSTDASAIPEWMSVQFTIKNQTVLNVRLEPIQVATRGLTLTLEETARYEPYAGAHNESSAHLLVVGFSATNPTDMPVTYSPFDWTMESGGVVWRYHHRSSHRSIVLVAPGERISGAVALHAPLDTPRAPSLQIAYQEQVIRTVESDE